MKYLTITLMVCLLMLTHCSFLRIEEVLMIKIKGSDTMLILTRLLAEEYMKTHPNVSIYVSGGGSASGFKSLGRGEADICASSRPLQADEAKLLAESFESVGVSFIVAKDALSIFLNPANPVQELKLTDLKSLFSGRITNWKQLNGDDAPVNLYIRNPNSGTYLYFKEHILNEAEYSTSAIICSTTESIVNSIALDKYGIGYGGIAYGKNIYQCPIEGVHPSIENVRNDTYPISRYLYFYTINMPAGEIKAFLDWVVSSEGQKVIEKTGYISLWER